MTEIDELIQRGKFPDGLVFFDLERIRLPLLLGTKPVGKNFARNSEKILGLLKYEEECIIGVYGMGGVGKSTLLMQIHNQLLRDRKKYGHIYWVTVSQNCSVEKLQRRIAKVLGVELDDEDDVMKRAAFLRRGIDSKGPLVLILDDMWKEIKGHELGIQIQGSRCKIILSTRSLEVCRRMTCKEDFIIKVDILSKSEVWNLFVEKLGHYDTLDDTVKEKTHEVAEECGGLPLAIATMARSMSGISDILEWRNACIELKTAQGQADMVEDVLSILKVSYDRLNDVTIQKCFLSCILYPEDGTIMRKELINLWICEGLLDERASWEEQIIKGHYILNKLENLCLLESFVGWNAEKSVKMHDLIRDMALMLTRTNPCFMARSQLQLTEVPEEKLWSKNLLKVSLSHNYIRQIPCGVKPFTPVLRVLMLSCNLELEQIAEPFFIHMRSLTLLDFSGTNIKKLPNSISNLENLRSLLLKECEQLNFVPSVAKLTKLRVLKLPEAFSMLPEGTGSLRHLQELTPSRWVANDVTFFNKLVESWQLLELDWKSFVLVGYPLDPCKIIIQGDKQVFIKEISFNAELNCVLPVLPRSVSELELSHIIVDGWQSLVDFLPSFMAAKELRKMTLIKCCGIEYILAPPHPDCVFPSRETLSRLHYSSHLKELVLQKCPQMKVCPLILSLEKLTIEDCNELEYMFGGGAKISSPLLLTQSDAEMGNFDNPTEVFNQSFQLPKLKLLKLGNLPKLRRNYSNLQFWTLEEISLYGYLGTQLQDEIHSTNSEPVVAFSHTKKVYLHQIPKWSIIVQDMCFSTSLQDLSIIQCDMEEIFEAPGLSLPNLRSLDVRVCNKLKVLFPHEVLKGSRLPRLDSVNVSCCDELVEIFEADCSDLSIINCDLEENFEAPGLSLPNLRNLDARVCSKMKLLFLHKVLKRTRLPNLETVNVSHCDELVAIFEVDCSDLSIIHFNVEENSEAPGLALPNLRTLDVRGCNKLKLLFPHNVLPREGTGLPNLETVDVSFCDGLVDIFEADYRDCSIFFSSESQKGMWITNSATNVPDLNLSPIRGFPKLRVLKLMFLPRLRNIYRAEYLFASLVNPQVHTCFEVPSSILALTFVRELYISGCHEIKVLFTWKLLQHEQPLFPNLVKLKVWNCDSLEDIFEGGGSRSSGSSPSSQTRTETVVVDPMNVLPELKELHLYVLPNLRSVYRSMRLCASLEELFVHDC